MEREVKFEFNPRRVIAGDAGFTVGPVGASGEPAGAVYVSSLTGDDAGAGTEGDPVKTLYEAIHNRVETAIILIDGDYPVIGNNDLLGKTVFARDGVNIVDTWPNFSPFYLPITGNFVSVTKKNTYIQVTGTDIEERGEPSTVISSTALGDLANKAETAFADLSNVSLVSYFAALYNDNDKVLFYRMTADSAAHSLTGANVVVAFDFTAAALYYYHVDDIFDRTAHGGGTYGLFDSLLNVNVRPIVHPGNEAGTDYLIAQSEVVSAPNNRTMEFVAVKPNKGPTDGDWRENAETPFYTINDTLDETEISNGFVYGLSHSMPVNGVTQWVLPDRAIFANTNYITGGFVMTLDQLVTDMAAASGTWASLDGRVRQFLHNVAGLNPSNLACQGHALEIFYSGMEGANVPNSTILQQSFSNRARYNNKTWWNPFFSEISGPWAFDPLLISGTAPELYQSIANRTDCILHNGTLQNYKGTIDDTVFNKPTTQPTFHRRNTNFLSLMQYGTLKNCEIIGPSGSFVVTDSYAIVPPFNTINLQTSPITCAVAKGRIERSIISNYYGGNVWRNILGTVNDISIDSIFVQMGVAFWHSRGESCSVLNAQHILDNSQNTLEFDYLGINARSIFGQFIGGGLSGADTYSLTDCVIREGDTDGIIHSTAAQSNVFKGDPFYKSNVTPFNLRIQAFAKGDPLNSPAIGRTSKVSIHGGDRESGAYDDDSQLIELFEAITIFAPWVTRIPGERESQTNKLESGRRPTLALSKQTLRYQFRWELALTNRERQYVNRILQANSTKIRFYPKPVELPNVFLEGHIEPKTDYSSPRSVVDSAASNLSFTANFESPDSTVDINDYL